MINASKKISMKEGLIWKGAESHLKNRIRSINPSEWKYCSSSKSATGYKSTQHQLQELHCPKKHSVSTEILDWGFLYLLEGKVGGTWRYKNFKHPF